MTTVTESDIKEIKNLISAFREDVNRRLDSLDKGQKDLEKGQKDLEKGQQELKLEITEIKTKLSMIEPSIQKIPDLAEKVGELKNWKQIGLTLTGAIIGGVITYLAKTPNP